MEGVAEWQVNAVIVSVLIRKFTHRRVVTSMAVAMHLFHGAVLGVVFRLLPLGLPGTTILSSIVPSLCDRVLHRTLDHLPLSY